MTKTQPGLMNLSVLRTLSLTPRLQASDVNSASVNALNEEFRTALYNANAGGMSAGEKKALQRLVNRAQAFLDFSFNGMRYIRPQHIAAAHWTQMAANQQLAKDMISGEKSRPETISQASVSKITFAAQINPAFVVAQDHVLPGTVDKTPVPRQEVATIDPTALGIHATMAPILNDIDNAADAGASDAGAQQPDETGDGVAWGEDPGSFYEDNKTAIWVGGGVALAAAVGAYFYFKD